MAENNELQFVLKMKDEASATLKAVQGTLGNVGSSVSNLTTALKDHAVTQTAITKAQEALNDKMNEGQKFLGSLLPFFKAMGPAGMAAAGAIGAIGAAMGTAIHTWADYEKQALKFNLTMKAIGQEGKASFDELDDAAERFTYKTIFGVDEIRAAYTKLAQTAVLSRDQMDKLLPKVLDYAASRGQSPGEAANMVALAYQNPERAMMMMKRTLRNITPAIQDEIERLVNTGETEKAGDMLVARMTKKSAGMAEAMTAGVSGGLSMITKQMGVYAENSAEWWGKDIANATGLADKLKIVADWWIKINEERAKNREKFEQEQDLKNSIAYNSPLAQNERNDALIAKYDANPALKTGPGAAQLYANLQRNRTLFQQQYEDSMVLGQGIPGNISAADYQTSNQSAKDRQTLENTDKYLKQYSDEIEARKKLQDAVDGLTNGYNAAIRAYGEGSDKANAFSSALGFAKNALTAFAGRVEALARDWANKLSLAGMGKFDQATVNNAIQWRAAQSGVKVEDIKVSDIINDAEAMAAGGAQVTGVARATQGAQTDEIGALAKYRAALKAANAGKNAAAKKKAEQQLAAAQATLNAFPSLDAPGAADFMAREMGNAKATDTSVDTSGSDALKALKEQGAQYKHTLGLYQSGATDADIKAGGEAFKYAFEQAKAGTSSFAAAMAVALPILKERTRLETEIAMAESDRKNALLMANVEGQRKTGTEFGGLQAQWRYEAQQKGVNVDDYVANQMRAYQAKGTGDLVTGTTSLNRDTSQKNFEAGIAGMPAMSQDIERQMYALRQLAAEQKISMGSEDWEKRKTAIEANAAATEKLRIANGPLNTWIREGADTWATFQNAAVSALEATSAGFVDVALNGKKVGDVVGNLTKSLANMLATAAFKSIGGSIINTLMPSVGGLSKFFGFADGGIMTDKGPLPLRKYAGGGVANSPQVAIFGEGKHNEAFVPLPDGRSIPVSMKGGSGGGASIQNNFNVTVSPGAGAQSGGGGGGSPQMMGQGIASALRNMVVDVLHEQLRTGGALSPSMGS